MRGLHRSWIHARSLQCAFATIVRLTSISLFYIRYDDRNYEGPKNHWIFSFTFFYFILLWFLTAGLNRMLCLILRGISLSLPLSLLAFRITSLITQLHIPYSITDPPFVSLFASLAIPVSGFRFGFAKPCSYLIWESTTMSLWPEVIADHETISKGEDMSEYEIYLMEHPKFSRLQ